MLDTVCLWLARHMPRRLRYWAVIVAGADATTGKWSATVVPDITFMEVLQRTPQR
jgi:hypothetical protein